MRSKLTLYFIDSAAALLAAFTAALFLCNFASAKLAQPHDPIFAIPMDAFFWILGLGALSVMFACIFMQQPHFKPHFKLVVVLWFATNLIIYRLGLQWQGVQNLRGYVGSLTHTFNLSDNFTNSLLSLLFLYLFIGSAVLLIWNFLARPEEVLLTTTCDHCGGRIEFPVLALGQNISCPHCAKTITRLKPT